MSGEALGLPDETTVIDAPLAAAPGWFGKLAMLGDFANRRLPPAFIERCDEWLSSGMAASRAQLGARWLDTYLTGPIWRFAFAPGVIDGQWWFGTLMPSVDAVGRYFPLAVALARDAPPSTGDAFDTLERWYMHVATAALETLEGAAGIDAFEAALARAPLLGHTMAPLASVTTTTLASRDRHLLAGAGALRQWATMLAMRELLRAHAGHSFWSPLPHANEPASLSLSPGLPSPGEFALMLEGCW